MHYSQLAMAAAMLISAAAATPISENASRHAAIMKNPRLAALMKRQDSVSWTSADGGNINMFFSDETVTFGNMNPVDIINNNVSVSCNTEGACETETVDLGTVQYGTGPDDEDLSYTVDGQYASYIHNGFIALLAGVMQNQTTSSQVCVPSSCPDPESYCPPSGGCQTEYQAPRHIGVIFNNNDPSSTPSVMQVDFTVTAESAGSLCSDFTTLGGVLTSLIPGIGGAASGLFTLAGLGCSD